MHGFPVAALELSAMRIPGILQAISSCTGDKMLVYSGSNSMVEIGFKLFEDPRTYEARRAIQCAVPDITETGGGRPLALRTG
jgi:hypothetical protein